MRKCLLQQENLIINQESVSVCPSWYDNFAAVSLSFKNRALSCPREKGYANTNEKGRNV